MDQNVTVDNDLQKAIDDITQNTNADPVFSDPVAAPSSVPEGDTGELAAPVGPFPEPIPEPETTQVTNYAATPVPDIIPATEPTPAVAPSAAPAPAAIAPEVPTIAPEAPITTSETSTDSNLNMQQVKVAALRDLVPLLDHLDMDASQKFSIYKNMVEDLHDYSVLEPAYHVAAEIADETERAEALLYLVELIDKM